MRLTPHTQPNVHGPDPPPQKRFAYTQYTANEFKIKYPGGPTMASMRLATHSHHLLTLESNNCMRRQQYALFAELWLYRVSCS